MRRAPLLYARIDIPTLSSEPCDVYCRECKDYRVVVPNLQAARRTAWSHDVDHWRRRIPPSTPRKPKRQP